MKDNKFRYVLMSLAVIFVLATGACTAAAPAATAVVAPATTAAVEPAAPTAVALPAEIVVGVVQPLTGPFAVFGKEGQIGAELAIKHINEAGGIKSMGGIQIRLVVEDAGGTADSAKLATESMISKNHPVAILGEYISRFVMAASEVTDREKVILIADALVPQITQMGRQYLFRPGPTATNHGAMAYQFVKDTAAAAGIEIKSMAILNEDSANGRANS